MTPNQMIDGVPRELRSLLERIVAEPRDVDAQVSRQGAVDELRALLDAPATCVCRGCFTEQPIGKACATCAEVEAQRAAQDQGKPVYMVRSHGSCCWEEMRGESLEMCQAQPGEYEVRKLYAMRSAPVAVDRPTYANPPPGAQPCGAHHDNDGLDEMRK